MSPLRLSPVHHVFSAFAAVFITVMLFAGAAANAQTRTAYYTAEMAQPADPARFIAANVAWTCAGTTCTAPRGTSRPAIICARVVREAGAVTRFVANGQELDAEALARCNAVAG